MVEVFANLFEYYDWVDLDVIVFYDCKLINNIGDYRVGQEFKTIIWNFNSLSLEMNVST